MAMPANVDTGRVEGRFVVGVADGPDSDDEPDALPAKGTVTFTASVPYLPNPTASPAPVTVLKAPIVAVLDSEGYLCVPGADGNAGARGVRLVATDDPDLSVQGWTWTVTYAFENVNGVRPQIASHSMALPSGSTVDLTSVVKVPSSTGIGVEQAEALAASAHAAATDAQAAALAAADAASQATQATDTAIAGLVGEATTATSGALAERFVVYREWSDGAYPARVTGASNIFIGPTDPGLAMDPDMDLWAQPDVVTLDGVTAELRDSSSAMFEAAAVAGAGANLFVPHGDFQPFTATNQPVRGFIGTYPSMNGYVMPHTTPTSRVGAEVRTPRGWNAMRVFVLWTHDVPTPDQTQAVRWEVIAAPLTADQPFTSGTSIRYGSSTAPVQYGSQSGLVFENGGGIAVDPAGGQVRIGVVRRTDVATDTFENSALFRGVLLERIA